MSDLSLEFGFWILQYNGNLHKTDLGESRIIILGTKCFTSSKPCTKQEPPQHPCEVGKYYYPYLTNGKPYTERLNDLLKTTVNQQQGWDKNSSPTLLPSQCQ